MHGESGGAYGLARRHLGTGFHLAVDTPFIEHMYPFAMAFLHGGQRYCDVGLFADKSCAMVW